MLRSPPHTVTPRAPWSRSCSITNRDRTRGIVLGGRLRRVVLLRRGVAAGGGSSHGGAPRLAAHGGGVGERGVRLPRGILPNTAAAWASTLVAVTRCGRNRRMALDPYLCFGCVLCFVCFGLFGQRLCFVFLCFDHAGGVCVLCFRVLAPQGPQNFHLDTSHYSSRDADSLTLAVTHSDQVLLLTLRAPNPLPELP